MSTTVDPSYFDALAGLRNSSSGIADYDTETGNWTIRLWDVSYTVNPHDRWIKATGTAPGNSATSQFDLFIIYILLNGRPVSLANEWISEKDIPGGAAFFRGPHTLPTESLTRRFGNDIGAFTAACKALAGRPMGMADAAFFFNITPYIPVAALYWNGDDDFPPEARLLFDRSISTILPLDIIFCLALETCARIII